MPRKQHAPSSSCDHEHGGHDHSHSHAHGHDHSHGRDAQHEHAHAHGSHCDHNHAAEHDHDHSHDHGHSHAHGHDHDHSHDHSHGHHEAYRDPMRDLEMRLASTTLSTAQSIAEKNATVGTVTATGEKIEYTDYKGEEQISAIMSLIEKDLSEPYSIFTYRYFIRDWPRLCVLANLNGEIIGTIVCKLDTRQRSGAPKLRGYIAMLAVHNQHRKLGIGSRLVREAIHRMILENADEVVLETEITNKGALALYETLGFIRDKRLHKYYLNGGDAFRLVLPLTPQFLLPAPME